ncbi:MAG: hypothetical protein P8N76_13110 [Pirellulaceae bacterium]|nr:hypothetical protein [Pirellulaceae bacterium]
MKSVKGGELAAKKIKFNALVVLAYLRLIGCLTIGLKLATGRLVTKQLFSVRVSRRCRILEWSLDYFKWRTNERCREALGQADAVRNLAARVRDRLWLVLVLRHRKSGKLGAAEKI